MLFLYRSMQSPLYKALQKVMWPVRVYFVILTLIFLTFLIFSWHFLPEFPHIFPTCYYHLRSFSEFLGYIRLEMCKFQIFIHFIFISFLISSSRNLKNHRPFLTFQENPFFLTISNKYYKIIHTTTLIMTQNQEKNQLVCTKCINIKMPLAVHCAKEECTTVALNFGLIKSKFRRNLK